MISAKLQLHELLQFILCKDFHNTCNTIKDIYFGSNHEKKVFSKKTELKDIKNTIVTKVVNFNNHNNMIKTNYVYPLWNLFKKYNVIISYQNIKSMKSIYMKCMSWSFFPPFLNDIYYSNKFYFSTSLNLA